jgi:hypothetical protein
VVDDERDPKAPDFAYSAEERAALDEAATAFAPIIKAIDTLEDIERWVPPVVKGVRALRDRAMRDAGALTYHDNQYRLTFRDLLHAEPIGPWLLDEHRRSFLDAIHFLGSDDTFLDTFMEWRRTKLSDEQRRKWRQLRTLVDHFKQWQCGIVLNTDRRTDDQKQIERVRADGHKADAAALAEIEQTRRELATRTIESSDTLWGVLEKAGPEGVFHCVTDHGAKDYAHTLYELLAAWLKGRTE